MSYDAAKALRFPGHLNDSCRLSSQAACCKDTIPKSSMIDERDDMSSPKMSMLAEHQLYKLFHGEFPSDYPFEVIHLKSSTAEAYRASNALENHKRIRVTTDRNFSITTIRNAPTPLHQWMLAEVTRSLQSQIPGDARILLDSLLLTQRDTIIPDLQYVRRGQEITEDTTVLTAEVGFSQQYESLKHAACRVIDQTEDINISLMINIKERPAFRTPVSPTSSGIYRHPVTKEDVDKETILAWLKSPAKGEKPLPEDPNDPESPLFLLGARWVGRIEATLEVWIRDPRTKKATRKLEPILFYGSKAKLDKDTPYIDARSKNIDVGLKLSDIISSTDENLKKPFIIDWADWRRAINNGRNDLAFGRFWTALEAIEGTKTK